MIEDIYTSDEQMNATGLSDFVFVLLAFVLKVCSVAVEDVDVLRKDVNVLEEVVPHEIVIALRMLPRQSHVLVHVKRLDVFERNPSLLMEFDQLAVHPQRCASCNICIQ